MTDDDKMIEFREHEDGVSFAIRVSPRAKRNAINGLHRGALKIATTAPPVDGKANAALIKQLAKAFGVPKSAVVIVSGDKGRDKRVRVAGITASMLVELAKR